MNPRAGRLVTYARLVQLQHTLFALPFALAGAFLGARGVPGAGAFLAVAAAMFGLRTAAMAFNRIVDRRFDARNPRTAGRELPTGRVSLAEAWTMSALGLALFLAACRALNTWTLALAPLAILLTFGYSLTKRFTSGSHLVLGAALGLAPFGGYLATHGSPAGFPWALAAAVVFWVAGFDVIYALQDEEFDKSQKLYSMPSFFGKTRALRISEWMHLGTAALMVFAGKMVLSTAVRSGWLFWFGTIIFLVLLTYQHLIVKPNDLSRVNMAFFTTNGIASLLFGTLAIADILT